ncbi:MAG TPA: glycoside hydrolase family 5 protein [Anaerolineaceae bacterium]|nr:glycoside hydrolase family 5 protein [Anaerolineaceae bacterium]HPN53378.1 glycoside hydrolase family 5 protein [Anaerolineaceae bacterium]
MLKRLLWLALGLLLSACTAATPTPLQETPAAAASPTPGPEITAFDQARRLGRGVNLGNALEAPNEGDWGVLLNEDDFKLIAEAGFDSVRLPVRFSAHALREAPYTIDPAFFERVDWAVDQALKHHLAVIIDLHHYEEMYVAPEGERQRFTALWEQIAARYQAYPDTVYFELMNEPGDALSFSLWNSLLKDALAAARQTNPERAVIIGPVAWYNVNFLPGLVLPPDDRHLIGSFHYYIPFEFTHQGADWMEGSSAWLGTTWQGTEAELRIMRVDFDKAAAWSKAEDRPVYLGEFGAFSTADMASRVRWTAAVARLAESLNMPWAYWEFRAGFGVYDGEVGKWNQSLLDALMDR